ncbi:MAG: hypothetical protein K9H26_04825 [Prolixibacteraceae bacterium]|nr:hypothetical protein [Prolixibacteraceae bacterium]
MKTLLFKLKTTAGISVFTLCFFAFFISHGQKVVKLWETEAVFSGPESAVYDPVSNFIYISNYTRSME